MMPDGRRDVQGDLWTRAFALTIWGRGADEERHGLGCHGISLGFSTINKHMTEQPLRPVTWKRGIEQKYNHEVEDRYAPVFARLQVFRAAVRGLVPCSLCRKAGVHTQDRLGLAGEAYGREAGDGWLAAVASSSWS